MEDYSKYDKETLKRIRESLPYRAVKLVAERSGFSTQTVRRFFRGEMTVDESSFKIIRQVNKLQREYEASAEKTNAEIMEALKRNSTPPKLYNNGTN
jgi:transcriptional regulator with XRE-family HTH domain